MPRETFSFRLESGVEFSLSERTRGSGAAAIMSRSAVINRDLGRLYGLYDRALRGLNLTVEQCLLLCDALKGVLSSAAVAPAAMLSAGVADSIMLDRLEEKWGVDGAALVAFLALLTDCQAMALTDAAERFWAESRDRDARELAAEVFRLRSAEERQNA